jgi:mutator protein MutT
MKTIETTLLLLKQDDKILLALKKKGHGVGKYNGVGGKLEPGETPEQAMIREAYEEILIVPTEYEKMGENTFLEFINGEQVILKFHLYIASKWSLEPAESDEMQPYWFDINNIPYDKMFPADSYWLPLVLAGKKINGYFEFDEANHLIKCNVEELPTYNQ